MEDINKEKYISKSHIPVSVERTEEIVKQMKNCICKIYKGGFKGTGFFCKIDLLSSNKNLYALITNNHVLDENSIKNDSTISFSIGDNEKQIKKIRISSDRKKYTNKGLDTTIIEINPEEDGISENNFLEVDENINQDEESLINIYEKKSIYLLGYPEGSNAKVSYGILDQLKEGEINHFCSTEKGSSGSPILLSENSKVIGIHFGCPKNNKFDFNYGTFILFPFIKFLNNEEDKITLSLNEEFLNNINEEEKETDIFSLNDNKDKKYEIIPYKIENDENSLKYFKKLEEKVINDNLKKYTKIIFEIFMTLKENEKKENMNYSMCFYENNLFKWEIKNEEVPIIMDFSNPPEYDLLQISFIKYTNRSLNDYYKINHKINLEKENINIICEKIISFLKEINNKCLIKYHTCPKCLIL